MYYFNLNSMTFSRKIISEYLFGRAPAGRAIHYKSSLRYTPLWAFHCYPSRKPITLFFYPRFKPWAADNIAFLSILNDIRARVNGNNRLVFGPMHPTAC